MFLFVCVFAAGPPRPVYSPTIGTGEVQASRKRKAEEQAQPSILTKFAKTENSGVPMGQFPDIGSVMKRSVFMFDS